MSTPDGRERMLMRHEIVVRIIDANSRDLRIEKELNALDIQRRDLERKSPSMNDAEAEAELARIEAGIADVKGQREKLHVEREWLNQSLTEFDVASDSDAKSKAKQS